MPLEMFVEFIMSTVQDRWKLIAHFCSLAKGKASGINIISAALTDQQLMVTRC